MRTTYLEINKLESHQTDMISYWIWWGFIIRDLLTRHGALGAKYKRPLIMNMGCRLTWMILLVGWFDRCVALYTVLEPRHP